MLGPVPEILVDFGSESEFPDSEEAKKWLLCLLRRSEPAKRDGAHLWSQTQRGAAPVISHSN